MRVPSGFLSGLAFVTVGLVLPAAAFAASPPD